jgi:hypothetical protein
MKRNFLLLFAFVILVFSCSKEDTDTSNPPPPDENKEPIRVEKVIHRSLLQPSQRLVIDTFTFEYDDLGRVMKYSHFAEASNFSDYIYTNGQLTAITAGPGSASSLNFSKYSADGDTILLDYSGPDETGDGIDTFQVTYIFKDGINTEFWAHFHYYSNDFIAYEKHIYTYNEQGNLATIYQKSTAYTWYNLFTVLEWDDKVNPKYGQPKENQILQNIGLIAESSSLHNPIKYQDNAGNIHTIKMTYNDEGYPLTVAYDDEDFIRTEIFYNR